MVKIKDVAKAYLRTLDWRGIINWILLIVLIVGGVNSCTETRELKRQLEQAREVGPLPATPIVQEAEKLASKVDEVGREATIFDQAEPIVKYIEDNTRVDSLKDLVGIKDKEITSVVQINGKLSKQNTDLKRVVETLSSGKPDTTFQYSDPWLYLSAYKKNDSVFTIGNLVAEASVDKIDYSRKKFWLFGANQNLATVMFNSPYVKVDGLKTMTVKQKEPKIDLNVFMESRYLHSKHEVLVGPRVRLNIGRIGVSGGYMVNPANNTGSGPWYGLDWKLY